MCDCSSGTCFCAEPSSVCDPDTEVFCFACREGDCCDGSDCQPGYYCENNYCVAEPAECSNCLLNYNCCIYQINSGELNDYYNFSSFNFGDFTELAYTESVGTSRRRCDQIVNNCDEETSCSICNQYHMHTASYNYTFCYQGQCYFLGLKVPTYYPGSGTIYYALSYDEVAAIVCDSFANNTTVSASDLLCHDTNCSQSIQGTQDSCQRDRQVSNALLPIHMILSPSTSPDCPNNCGGTGTECTHP